MCTLRPGACRRHMVRAATVPARTSITFAIMRKGASFSPFTTLVSWSVRKNRHFGFSSFPSSLFVGDLPVSSSPFFAFDLSTSKDLIFGCSPFAATEDAPGLFSVKASCSNSAANCSTLTSFGVVSTPRPDRTRESLNCNSRWLSRSFLVICWTGGTAPVSLARFLHRSCYQCFHHIRNLWKFL